jgi:hypothetical protein
MLRQSTLFIAATYAAGLLFVNIYNSVIDATSWGSNIPVSIETAKEYFKIVNPGNFMRIASPINQLLTLIALITCWKMGKKMRIYCGSALLIAVLVDVFTFGYFYPRLNIMFIQPITNVEAIKTAWSEWSSMNWVRSGLVLINLVFDFIALTLLLKTDPKSPAYSSH